MNPNDPNIPLLERAAEHLGDGEATAATGI